MILKTTESGSQYRNDATRLAKRVEARAEREQVTLNSEFSGTQLELNPNRKVYLLEP